jgi:hypothetical protein
MTTSETLQGSHTAEVAARVAAIDANPTGSGNGRGDSCSNQG